MRVISGTARGCSLVSPVGEKTRPTGDRMKEDLFNILAHKVKGAVFLDVYCGSGAMGIEAISRGASAAIFVDESPNAIKATKANLQKTRLHEKARILHMPAAQALLQLKQSIKHDIIFLDPPYESTELTSSLTFIDQNDLLVKGGIIVAETMLNFKPPELDLINIYRTKKYKQMQFIFYEFGDILESGK